MKYLFTYGYSYYCEGRTIVGTGSMRMTTNENKITEEVIDDAIKIIEDGFKEKGYGAVLVAPTGWFKFEEKTE